jgi:hypothetical protein
MKPFALLDLTDGLTKRRFVGVLGRHLPRGKVLHRARVDVPFYTKVDVLTDHVPVGIGVRRGTLIDPSNPERESHITPAAHIAFDDAVPENQVCDIGEASPAPLFEFLAPGVLLRVAHRDFPVENPSLGLEIGVGRSRWAST